MSLGLIVFEYITLGCIALISGIVIQFCHKFYIKNLLPSFAIANLDIDMADILDELA